ncbi:hypothetical protein D3C85_1905760 [compost metagenome]
MAITGASSGIGLATALAKFAVEGLLESLATYYKPAFGIDDTLRARRDCDEF